MDRASLLSEAYRRGILPPDQVATYEEGVRRGLLQADGPTRALIDARKASSKAGSREANPSGRWGRAALQAITLSAGDEIVGLGEAAKTGVKNLYARSKGEAPAYSAADAYRANVQSEREQLHTFEKDHPVQNLFIQLAGGGTSLGAKSLGRYVSGAPNIYAAAGRGAAVGAGYGAVTGAAGAEGDLRDRAVGAAKGAAGGAVLGGAAPFAARGVQVAVGAGRTAATSAARTANRALNRATGGGRLDPQQEAVSRLSEALQQDGLTAQQIQGVIRQWQASGVTPEFLNVVGENTRALFRAAAGKAGPGRSAAQAYRNTTVASIPNRAIERANTLTPGETRTPAQFAEETTAAREESAAQNYAQWSDEPVEIPELIQDMLADSSGRSIVARARADAIENQDWGRQVELERLLRPTEDGQLPRISAGTIDRLVIAARERGAQFARRGNGNRARGAFGRREQLNDVLSGVPQVQPSRAAYRDQSQAIEAAEGGPSVLGPRSEFQPAHEAIAGNELATQGAQIRERQALRDGFGTRDQVRGRLADIADAPDVRPNLNQLYGPEGDRFADAAGNLVQKQDHANYIAPNTGSQTELRGDDKGSMLGIPLSVRQGVVMAIDKLRRGLTLTPEEREVLVQIGISPAEETLSRLPVPATPARVAPNYGGGAVPALTIQSGRTANR